MTRKKVIKKKIRKKVNKSESSKTSLRNKPKSTKIPYSSQLELLTRTINKLVQDNAKNTPSSHPNQLLALDPRKQFENNLMNSLNNQAILKDIRDANDSRSRRYENEDPRDIIKNELKKVLDADFLKNNSIGIDDMNSFEVDEIASDIIKMKPKDKIMLAGRMAKNLQDKKDFLKIKKSVDNKYKNVSDDEDEKYDGDDEIIKNFINNNDISSESDEDEDAVYKSLPHLRK